MNTKHGSRRDFLKVAAGTVGAGLLVGHGQSGILQPEAAVAATSRRSLKKIEPSGVLWGLQYAPHVAAYQRLADLFHQTTGSTLTIKPQPFPLEPKMIAAVAAGTEPDVACILGSAAIPIFMRNVLQPLDDIVFKAKHVDLAKDFVGDSVQAFTWEGQILGVPVESNAIGFVCSLPVDEIRAKGLGSKYPPTNGKVYFDSYPAMWQLAKALQTTRNGRVTRYGLSSTGWEQQSMFGIMRSLGVKWWDLSAKKFNLDSEAGITAMKLLVETPVKMGIETALPPAQDSGTAVLAGKVAICRGNSTPALQGRPLGFHYDTCGAPSVIPGKEPLFTGEGGWGFAALKKAKNPGVATAFVQMMASQQAQLAYGKIYSGIPFYAWKGLAHDTTRFTDPSPTSPEVLAAKVFGDLESRTVYFGEQCGYYSLVAAAVTGAAAAVRQGHLTSAAAVKRIQADLEAQYRQFARDLKSLG